VYYIFFFSQKCIVLDRECLAEKILYIGYVTEKGWDISTEASSRLGPLQSLWLVFRPHLTYRTFLNQSAFCYLNPETGPLTGPTCGPGSWSHSPGRRHRSSIQWKATSSCSSYVWREPTDKLRRVKNGGCFWGEYGEARRWPLTPASPPGPLELSSKRSKWQVRRRGLPAVWKWGPFI